MNAYPGKNGTALRVCSLQVEVVSQNRADTLLLLLSPLGKYDIAVISKILLLLLRVTFLLPDKRELKKLNLNLYLPAFEVCGYVSTRCKHI